MYHRLNVIRLQLPTLAERRSDIPQLAQHFLQKAAKELNAEPKQLTAAAEALLRDADWPGNVRQLENTCRWLTVMAPGRWVDVADLPEGISSPPAINASVSETSASDWQAGVRAYLKQRLRENQSDLLPELMTAIERIAIELALESTDGHKQQAAEKLGWGRNTLTRKLKELVKET